MKKITADVTVNLPTPPHLAGLIAKSQLPFSSSDSNPFINANGVKSFLDLLEARGLKKLQEEESKR